MKYKRTLLSLAPVSSIQATRKRGGGTQSFGGSPKVLVEMLVDLVGSIINDAVVIESRDDLHAALMELVEAVEHKEDTKKNVPIRVTYGGTASEVVKVPSELILITGIVGDYISDNLTHQGDLHAVCQGFADAFEFYVSQKLGEGKPGAEVSKCLEYTNRIMIGQQDPPKDKETGRA